VFGAIGQGQPGELEVFLGDNTIAEDESVAELVGIKEIGRQREAASVSLAAFWVDRQLHDPSFVVVG
jgi:hypothetical protein